jgi:hypothetical protein
MERRGGGEGRGEEREAPYVHSDGFLSRLQICNVRVPPKSKSMILVRNNKRIISPRCTGDEEEKKRKRNLLK